MADFITNNEEERLIGNLIEKGLEIKGLSKYYILRIALARALNLTKLPKDAKDWDNFVIKGSERGSEYHLKQISGKGADRKEDFDTLLKGLFYVRHKEELLRNREDIFKDERVYLNILSKYIRRGLYEIYVSYKNSDCFYQWCLDNLNLETSFAKEKEYVLHDGKYFDRLKKFYAKKGIEIQNINEFESYMHFVCHIRLMNEDKIKVFQNTLKELEALINPKCFVENRGNMEFLIQIPKESSDDYWCLGETEFKQGIDELKKRQYKAGIFVGFDVYKQPFCFDIEESKHIFVAGTTGSGKSQLMRVMMKSLMINPNVDIFLIDPKGLDYKDLQKVRLYENPHEILDILIDEINDTITPKVRYKILFIDEVAVLFGKDKSVREKVNFIATIGRASKVFLVLGTQSPSHEIFDIQLRDNVSSRIALKVAKGTGSIVALDEGGAEKLLGRGHMLVKIAGKEKRQIFGVLDKGG